MQIKFEEREREIMKGLLLMTRQSAFESKDEKLTKVADKVINQLASNSGTSNISKNNLKEIKAILEFVTSTADSTDEDGRRELSEEDETTIRGIIGKI